MLLDSVFKYTSSSIFLHLTESSQMRVCVCVCVHWLISALVNHQAVTGHGHRDDERCLMIGSGGYQSDAAL